MTEALEISTQHRCHLGKLTDELAEHARAGERGERLAERARSALGRLLLSGDFERCCVPVYVAVAPKVFEREFQIPVASVDMPTLETRAALADRSEGCATSEVLTAGDGITHHLHNRGDEVALSVHVFGT